MLRFVYRFGTGLTVLWGLVLIWIALFVRLENQTYVGQDLILAIVPFVLFQGGAALVRWSAAR